MIGLLEVALFLGINKFYTTFFVTLGNMKKKKGTKVKTNEQNAKSRSALMLAIHDQKKRKKKTKKIEVGRDAFVWRIFKYSTRHNST